MYIKQRKWEHLFIWLSVITMQILKNWIIIDWSELLKEQEWTINEFFRWISEIFNRVEWKSERIKQ